MDSGGRLGTQDSVMSEDEAGDDGASLYGDFLVDGDDDDENVSVAGGGRRRQSGGHRSSGSGASQEEGNVDGLLEDLTNLSVTEIGPQVEKGGGKKRKETGSKNKKKSTVPRGATAKGSSVKGWSVERVAQAVRESGRALGPRSACTITSGEWSRHRKRLTVDIFNDINARAFDNGLPQTLEVVWSARLLTTAGRSINSWTKYGPRMRTSKIELATKVIDDPVKLMNTLGHELAHAAVWVISHSSEGHGKIWMGWMQQIHALYPGFDVSTRHGYAIHKPHRWRCDKCTSFEERHSKSVKVTDSCKFCGTAGSLEYLGKFDKTGTPAKTRSTPGKPNPYAEFTKQHMAEISASLPSG